jgi:hypothetical protein
MEAFMTSLCKTLFVIAIVALVGACPSFASCGSALCSLDTHTMQTLGHGVGLIGYEFEYIDQDQARIGRNSADIGQIRGHHDEVYTVSRVHRLMGSYGVTDRLGVEIALPFISRSHGHIHHHMGADLMETWSFGGLGDVSAIVSWALVKPTSGGWPVITASLGGEFPTGKHEVENEDGDHAEPGITPGSKSLDFLTGLSARWTPQTEGGREFPVFLSMGYRANGKGEEDYRLGDEFTANTGGSFPTCGGVSLLGQVNLRVAGRDSRGNTREEVEKTGGEYLFLTPGVEWHFMDDWAASALVQLPVYRRVNQIQLVSDYNLLLGLTYRFKRG